jgi:hypothetical protein
MPDRFDDPDRDLRAHAQACASGEIHRLRPAARAEMARAILQHKRLDAEMFPDRWVAQTFLELTK